MQVVTEEFLATRFAALKAGSCVVASGNFCTPYRLVDLVADNLDEFRLYVLNAQGKLPDREGITHETTFVGPAVRRSPRVNYRPARLSLTPALFDGPLAPDVLLLQTSKPRGGQVSLGLEVNIMPAALEAAIRRGALVVAQINPHMPYTHGDGEIDLSRIDYAIEVDTPVISMQPGAIDDESAAIGEAISHRIADGSTLQVGIGAVPDAVLASLSGRRGLRVWSEMFSDGIYQLNQAGALDLNHPIIGSFLFGSQELYDWVDDNPHVRLLRSEKVNYPGLIASQRQMVSVNTAMQVDLFVQANASRVGNTIFSGTGGQTDFIVGAMHSPGGQALLALKSWHPKADVSTIVGKLESPVTSTQVSGIVTEYGVAETYGRSQQEQASALIERAHPRARDGLVEEAAQLGLR